nr:MAG TPA_asm: hypothetical protein [Caudoviricetes sp.]
MENSEPLITCLRSLLSLEKYTVSTAESLEP